MIKILLGKGDVLSGRLLVYDALKMSFKVPAPEARLATLFITRSSVRSRELSALCLDRGEGSHYFANAACRLRYPI